MNDRSRSFVASAATYLLWHLKRRQSWNFEGYRLIGLFDPEDGGVKILWTVYQPMECNIPEDFQATATTLEEPQTSLTNNQFGRLWNVIFQYYLWRCSGIPRVHTRHSWAALSAAYARLQLKLRTSVLYVCKLRSRWRCQLLTSYCVGSRIMSMEQWCFDNDGGKPKYLVTNLYQCHSVQHKFHMDWFGIEPGPPQWQASD